MQPESITSLCVDCSKPIKTRAARCQSCARREMWRQRKAGTFSRPAGAGTCRVCGKVVSPNAFLCPSHHVAERNRMQRKWTLESHSVDADTGCWLWLGMQNGEGYGTYWDGDRLVPAYRAVYEEHRGSIPSGMDLDHLCRTPLCVNPDHLEPVSHATNVQRGLLARITAEDVRAIRVLAGTMSQSAIAAQFGLTQSQVSKIILRQRWRNIE